MNYLKVIFAGKVGRDSEMRYTPSGQAVTSFSVAVNENYTSAGGEKVKKTTWLRVTTWGKLAEICNQYVKKGMDVIVDGRLTPDATGGPRVYESKGEYKSSFEINATTVQFGGGQPTESHAQTDQLPPEDDLLF